MNTDKAWIYYNSPRICPQALSYFLIYNYDDTQNTHYVFDSLKRIERMITHVFLFHVLSQGLFN